jgi:hypothetical protein
MTDEAKILQRDLYKCPNCSVHTDSEFNFRRVAGTWIAAVGLLGVDWARVGPRKKFNRPDR